MPPLDFPSTPTVGQIYPAPNGIDYQWDGVKWIEVAGADEALTIVGTSTTSNSLTSGSHTFTTQTAKSFPPGSFITVVSRALPTVNWMWGPITAYNPSTGVLVVNAQVVGGTGTFTDWTIMISGARGPQGTQGVPGVQGVPGPPGTASPPSGTAGGDLSGTYPNPTIGNLKVTTAKIANVGVTPAKIAAGTDGQFLKTVGSGVAWGAGPSVTPTTPGGPANAVQYNSGGSFAGAAGLTFDGTNLNAPNVKTALLGKLMAGPDANYLWSNATYYIWQFDASPSASMYWQADARTLFLNTVSAGGTLFPAAQTWQSESGFRNQMAPWAYQANWNVLTAFGATRTGTTNIVDMDGLSRIAALQPIAFTHVPSARPSLTLSNVPMRNVTVPGPDGPVTERVPDFDAYPDPTAHGHREYLASRRTNRARSFDPDQFATVYPELVKDQGGPGGFKGIGLDMDFYADLVASIRALKKRVEDLEAALPPPPL